jgi:hypothetical protein
VGASQHARAVGGGHAAPDERESDLTVGHASERC